MCRGKINRLRWIGVMLLIGVAAFTASGGAGRASASVAANQGVFTMIPVGNQTTFGDNYNIAATGTYAPTSSTAPATGMMYEPLIHYDAAKGINVPDLARSWRWSNGGKTLTMQLQRHVKWSDGVPFTSADVKYTFVTIPRKYPKLPIIRPTFASLRTPTPYTVVFTFATPSVTSFGPWNWTTGYIVPKHQYEKQNLATWTDPNPVTTGPFVLEHFSPQEVLLKVRKNYWGGRSHGVQTVRIMAAATSTAAQELMLNGQGDYYGFNWPNYQSAWIAKDPAHHRFNVIRNANGAIEYNLSKPPFNNVHIRRAFAWAIDTAEVTRALNYGGVVPNVSGLNYANYGIQVAPEFRHQLQVQNVSKAKAELAASGYTVDNGVLTSGGQKYPLTFTANTGNGQIFEPIIVSNWKAVLGVNVSINYLDSTGWSTAAQNGDFQITDGAASGGGGGGCNTWCSFDGLAGGSNLVPNGQPAKIDWDRANDPVMTHLLNALASAPTPAQELKLDWAVQRRMVDQKFWAFFTNVGGSAAYSTLRWKWPTDFGTNPDPGTSGFGFAILALKPARG